MTRRSQEIVSLIGGCNRFLSGSLVRKSMFKKYLISDHFDFLDQLFYLFFNNSVQAFLIVIGLKMSL